MSDPHTRIVEEGYDVIGDRFIEWRGQIVGDPWRRWADELASRLSEGARVLELGCGAGVPDAQRFAARFRVTGVDISGEQVRRARANVPNADFVQADVTALELEPSSFEAVAAFYVLNHVPRELLERLFARIHSWLTPGGLVLASLGTSDTDSWTGDWLGTTMFFSSFPPAMNRRLLADAGFELLLDDVVTMLEPEPDGESTSHWVLAQR